MIVENYRKQLLLKVLCCQCRRAMRKSGEISIGAPHISITALYIADEAVVSPGIDSLTSPAGAFQQPRDPSPPCGRLLSSFAPTMPRKLTLFS